MKRFISVSLMLLVLSCGVSRASESVYALPPKLIVPGPKGAGPALLVRELIRQSVLMAARDEMGHTTRDAVLREFDPGSIPKDAALVLSIEAVNKPNSIETDATISKVSGTGADAQSTSIWEKNEDVSTLPYLVDAPKFVEIEEERARTTLVRALTDAGLKPSPPAAPAAGAHPLPDDLEELLYSTDFVDAFNAVRQLHDLNRTEGETAERDEGLARGYANLAELTELQWWSANEVFLARSLLYAQRSVVKFGKDPAAYYSRAYAEALGGLHNASQADLKKADTLWQGVHPNKADAPPPWTTVIAGVDEYSPVLLAKAAGVDKQHAPLYDLCTFLTNEQNGSTARFYQFGQQSLKSNPACYRILESLCSHAAVGPCNELTDIGPAIMISTLPAQLGHISDLPGDLQQAAKNLKPDGNAFNNLVNLTDMLRAADTSDGELPLSVLGNMVYETQFVLLCQRAIFIRDSWGVDSGDYIDAMTPLIKDHPYLKYFQSLRLHENQRSRAVASIDLVDPRMCMIDLLVPMLSLPPQQDRPGGQAAFVMARLNADPTAYAIAPMVSMYAPKVRVEESPALGEAMQKISFRSGIGEYLVARDHWDLIKAHADVLEKEFPQNPAILSLLASHFAAEKKTDDEIRVLERLVDIAGDYNPAKTLAELYLAKGDEDKWLKTLVQVTKRPDFGLYHAQAQAAIARHYVASSDFQKALPYADASAESGAEWALKLDAEVHEATGDHDGAEKLRQERLNHYGH
jgi:hypothetical protein